MTVHVIGAGMAGLAAAVRLVQRKADVVLWEAAPQAGGRVRSLECPVLGRTIDNGTHLMLSGNTAVRDYLKAIKATSSVHEAQAAFPFIDLACGTTWTVRPGALPLPLWLLSAKRRIPGAKFSEYLRIRRLAKAADTDTVADCVGTSGALVARFWRPITLAVMNAGLDEAAALPLARALGETLLRGAKACRPLLARDSLAASLVEPALERLAKGGAEVRFGQRLTRMVVLEDKARVLGFGDDRVELADDDKVVLAVPPWALAKVWPGVTLPTETRAILNVHYRVDGLAPDTPPLIGVVGGTVHWVAVRGDVVSVTVSAADALSETAGEVLGATLWPEVARVLGREDAAVPPYRVIKEHRATLLQTPATQPLRPRPRTGVDNIVLAGDWTATGLPATIEGALRSGFAAADVVGGLDF